jgi:hypothetical protein
MKPFKNKFLWKTFISILMLPLALLMGVILFGLIFGAIIGINIWVFDGFFMYSFSAIFYIWIVYKIFSDKGDSNSQINKLTGMNK